MAGEKMARDTWIFRTGLAVLAVVPVVVFLTHAASSGGAQVIFFVQVVLGALWVSWFDRRKRRAQRDAER
jgi:O-antigen/teichoic acid export membrane protein